MTLPEIISEARELLAKATKGPWFYIPDRGENLPGSVYCGSEENLSEQYDVLESYDSNDMKLIAFARNHLPKILDELEINRRLLIEQNIQVVKMTEKIERQGKAIQLLMDWKFATRMHDDPDQKLCTTCKAFDTAQSILSGESGV